ncbi:hypothetical protein GCM10027298_31850 [Epidermidibacterium keratini]
MVCTMRSERNVFGARVMGNILTHSDLSDNLTCNQCLFTWGSPTDRRRIVADGLSSRQRDTRHP